MGKRTSIKLSLSSILLVMILGFAFFPSIASADTVHITTFNGTTKASTTSAPPKNNHNFYSTKDTVKVNFKVTKWVKTHNKKKLNVKLQKSNGFWWSTKKTKSITNTSPINFSFKGGSGNYRLVVYDEKEPTGWSKPPLYYAKSTKYSVTVKGY